MLKKLKEPDQEHALPLTQTPARIWYDGFGKIIAKLWSYRWTAVAAITALALIYFVAVPFLLGPRVNVHSVIRADFVQTVVASGHVEAPFRVNVGSQITGIVASVPVNEGDTVRAGEPLVVLDDREARSSVTQAEGLVEQAEARMRQLKELTLPSAEEALKQAQATLLDAQRAYDRASALAEHGYGTKATLDSATRVRDVATAQVRNSEFAVYTSRPGGSDYVMAETQLSQARATLASAKSRLSYTVIVAPRDGVLISRDVERGNVVQPSNVLMKLSPSGDTQLVVQIDERNLGALMVGQPAIASADAFPKDKFPAEISYINPGVDLQSASVEVKLRVPDPPKYLRQDMTVSVDIKVARRPKALIVAAADVHRLDSLNPWVMKVDGGRAQRQPVKIGLFAGGKVEILEGLSENDLILPATVTSVGDGSRVRARVETPGPSP